MMKSKDANDARERIIDASIELFSKRGFHATTTSEIAEAAGVTKGLIYYYFKSKEEILSHVVNSLLEDATSITMDFVQEGIIQMIKDGELDIEYDRMKFSNEESATVFVNRLLEYYERILDYLLGNRLLLRVLMFESLKDSKHHNDLFRLLDLSRDIDSNPILKLISEADHDFTYSLDMELFKFFFSVMPLVTFAAYYDDLKERSMMSGDELRNSFLQSFRVVLSSLKSGNEISLRTKRSYDTE